LPRVRKGEDSTLLTSVLSVEDTEHASHLLADDPTSVDDSLASPSPIGKSLAVASLKPKLPPTEDRDDNEDDDDDVVLLSGLSTVHNNEELPSNPAAAAATHMVPAHDEGLRMEPTTFAPPTVCESPVKGCDPDWGEGVRKWGDDDEEDDYVVMDSQEFAAGQATGVSGSLPRVQFGCGLTNSLAVDKMNGVPTTDTATPIPSSGTVRPSEVVLTQQGASSTLRQSRTDRVRTATAQLRQSLLDLRSVLLEEEHAGAEADAESLEAGRDMDADRLMTAELTSVLNDLALTIHESASRPASRALRPSSAGGIPIRLGDVAADMQMTPAVQQQPTAVSSLLLTNVATAQHSLQLQALWDSVQQLQQQNTQILKAITREERH